MDEHVVMIAAGDLPDAVRGDIDPAEIVRVTVEIVRQDKARKKPPSLIGGALKLGRAPRTVADIDRQINEERDSWDR